MGITYLPKGSEAPAYDEFLRLNLLPRPTGRTFQDFFSGQRDKVTFELCQAVLSQGSGRSRRTVFSGQVLRLGTPKRMSSTTVVLRHFNLLTSSFTCPTGLARVGLEDPVFEKAFEAYGTDQVEAREILTPTVMQELVNLETAYGGEKLRCAFVDGDILIALESGLHFGFGSMFRSLVDRERAEAIAHDIQQVFSLIDAFKNL
jgi:hypothetical protein